MTSADLRVPAVMTIAGSDSSGGAGIQADLKTFTALGVYGASAITALTAQNTTGVQGVEPVLPAFVAAQIRSVLADLDVRAVKTGMLANAAIIEAVALEMAARPDIPLVIDPVMVATSGDPLIAVDAVATLKSRLIPLARVITPNLPEAAALLSVPVATTETEAMRQLEALSQLGARAVLLKGGHGEGAEAVDLLLDGGKVTRLASPRIATRNTHGTGCTLSAAIAAFLAQGLALDVAVARAKIYVHRAIESGRYLHVGAGHGPVDHLYAIKRNASAA